MKWDMNNSREPLLDLIERYPACAGLQRELETALGLLWQCVQSDGTLWLCGNGGSAADCEHWAGELLKSFSHPRSLAEAEQARLPDPLAKTLQPGMRAIPLTGFTALRSAFANDVDDEYVFAQLVWVLARPGDVLITISTSGNAANVCHAAHAARARGVSVLGLSGRSGGHLKDLCDCCIRVPEDVTYRIQELHLPIYHALSLALEAALEANSKPEAPR